MECSVKYIREVDGLGAEVGILKPALCFRGRKIVHAIINDELKVRSIELPLKVYDKAAPVLYHGSPYAPKAYADRLSNIAKRKGCTNRALVLLESPERDEDALQHLPPDEPTPSETPRNNAVSPPVSRLSTTRETGSSGVQSTAVAAPKPVDLVNPVPKMPPRPSKPPKSPKNKVAGDPGAVRQLAAELKLEPQPLRVLLRKAGLRAPYTDLEVMRKAIKK